MWREYRVVEASGACDMNLIVPSGRLKQICLGAGIIGIVTHCPPSPRPSRLEKLGWGVGGRDLQRIGARHGIAPPIRAPRTVDK